MLLAVLPVPMRQTMSQNFIISTSLSQQQCEVPTWRGIGCPAAVSKAFTRVSFTVCWASIFIFQPPTVVLHRLAYTGVNEIAPVSWCSSFANYSECLFFVESGVPCCNALECGEVLYFCNKRDNKFLVRFAFFLSTLPILHGIFNLVRE